jgi:UDP-4-amino-4,6-dideoxy-N-acetyl-beta-L-altrosamine transaminase
MHEFIPYGRQDVSEEDVQAVVRVLRSDWLTQGPTVPGFEAAVAARCKAAHAVAVNSATSALHLACLALQVGPGDQVWTSPITFVASANCARYCGADVDFVDIDPGHWCMSVERLAEKLARHRSAGHALPKVVIPVHLSGQSCDMRAIAGLGREYGFRVVEDASHAIGGAYLDGPVGDCRYSDITVFSFHPVKIITTGEGGMALTNDPAMHERMARLRTHGITRDPEQMARAPGGAWYYEQLDLGFNYRMTDLQAALGLSQLGRIDAFVRRRNELAQRYDAALEGLPVRRQHVPAGIVSARHLYPVRVDSRRRNALFDSLRHEGIGVNVHYIPVHLQPYYRGRGFRAGDFPEAEAYGEEAISLPLFPAMSDEQHRRVVAGLRAHLPNLAESP